MVTPVQYPFVNHPCYSNVRENLWKRIHLPVAPYCNVKCIFCDRMSGSACHTHKPGYAAQIMTPKEAIERTIEESDAEPNLRIVAISGPGEPLANKETFETFEGIFLIRPSFKFCLSSNGILLKEMVEKLRDLSVASISVTMSTQNPEIAAYLYEWANIDGNVLRGNEMGSEIITRQIQGIKLASEAGIIVKVNTVLIPGINDRDLGALSRCISSAGARLHNIVPLIPCDNAANLHAPSKIQIANARRISANYIAQFIHCKQCRSDVIGIPGCDRIL